MLTTALLEGRVVTIKCPNGDTMTAGQRQGLGSPESPSGWFSALRWGRSRWALPSGKEVAQDPRAASLAAEVVRHCGRGPVARGVRAA